MDESERFYKRFIDDMVAEMEGNKEAATQIVHFFNSIEPGLKI